MRVDYYYDNLKRESPRTLISHLQADVVVG